MVADSTQHRIKDLFDEAVERPEGERATFLDSACGADPAIRREVEHLLAALAGAPDFLESPPDTTDVDRRLDPDAAGPDPDLAGKAIGGYQLRRVIAAGGMGTVYEAVQEKPHRTVAVKVMKRGIASRSAMRRFEHESQILARLRHPGIAQVYEAGTWEAEGDVPYFVMEYVPGARPITEYARQRSLTTTQRLELFASVCQAVHHGHQRGIIHRDLKPANILIDASGEPKIIDFGVARTTDSDMAVTTLQTDVGQLIGTLQYMSPEQCQADPDDLDTRSDVYALGVVLYELLCDHLPYDVGHALPVEAIRVVEEEAPARPSSINRTLRGDVETILLKALEKDRDRRYQSAAGLAADITRYLNHEPIVARPPSATYQLRKFAQRHKGFVAGIGSIGAVLTIAMVVSGALIWQEQQRTAQALDLSETHFATAREAVDELFTTVANIELANVPHVEALRKDLLEKALVFYQGFLGTRSDDPAVRFETARARRRVGGIYRMLGERQHAEDALRGSTALAEELLSEAPADEHILDELARGLNELGHLLTDARRNDEAEEAFRESQELRQSLVDSVPVNREYAHRLASGFQDLGALLMNIDLHGRWEEAGELCSRSVTQFEALVDAYPEEETLRLELASAHNTLGELLWLTGRTSQAEATYRRALVMRESIAGDPAASTRFRKGLAENHSTLGRLLLTEGDPVEAEAYVTRAAELFGGLVEDFPMVPEFRVEVARCLGMAGTLSLKIARRGDEDTYLTGIAILHELAEEFPGHAAYRYDLGCMLNALGIYLIGIEARVEPAIVAWRESIAIFEELTADYPDDRDYRAAASGRALNLGHAYRRLGQLPAAEEAYRKAIRLSPQSEPWPQSGIGDTWHVVGDRHNSIIIGRGPPGTFDIAYLYDELGATLATMGRLQEAEWCLRHALTLTPGSGETNRLALFLANYGQDEVARHEAVDLATSAIEEFPEGRDSSDYYNTLGIARYRVGQWENAIEALDRAIELADDPSSFDLFYLAMAHWQLGEMDEARQWYEAGVVRMDGGGLGHPDLPPLRAEAAELLDADREFIVDPVSQDPP